MLKALFEMFEQAQCDGVLRLLIVEPEVSTALLLLDAIRAAGTPLEVSCVCTCDGALDALRMQAFDAILLSINLCYRDAEYDVLPSLARRAQLHGLPLIAVGPPGFVGCAPLLRVPLCTSLSHDDVGLGRLGEVLALARRKPRGAEPRLCGSERLG